MGVNFTAVVLTTFGIGSALAAFAGLMNGLYYNEINFGIGLLLGVIGFSAAIIGGLGSIYGAILGGFVFAALQTIGAVALPFASAYKDVFAFAVVIVELAVISWIRWRYMDTPFLSAAFQVMVGGALVFIAGILIGSS